MNTKSFHLSAQGASHIKKNKECQDASFSSCDDTMAIAVVSDGHGGNDYMRSAFGSIYACKAAELNIKEFLSRIDKEKFFEQPDNWLRGLEASIINDWNKQIHAHFQNNPLTEEELNGLSEKAQKKYKQGQIESAYGATLIAVAVTKDYWFGIHIGDGKCVAINPEGKFVQPIPWDSKCFLNATTSICDAEAAQEFRHFYSDKLPVAVFVGSDGVDDCFKSKEQLYNLYKTILYSFGTSEFEDAVAELKEYLPQLSKKGSGDDISIAGILDVDLVSNLQVVKEFDREKEKARIEEKARQQAKKEEEERRRIEQEYENRQNRNRGIKRLEYWHCPCCGQELLKGAEVCSNCTVKFVYCDCGNRLTETDRFCSKCGKENPFAVAITIEESVPNINQTDINLRKESTEDVPQKEREAEEMSIPSEESSEDVLQKEQEAEEIPISSEESSVDVPQKEQEAEEMSIPSEESSEDVPQKEQEAEEIPILSEESSIDDTQEEQEVVEEVFVLNIEFMDNSEQEKDQ